MLNMCLTQLKSNRATWFFLFTDRTSKFNKKKNKEKMPPQLFHSFGKTPFKNKSEIYSELMADLERVIIDDKYLEKSEIQVSQ